MDYTYREAEGYKPVLSTLPQDEVRGADLVLFEKASGQVLILKSRGGGEGCAHARTLSVGGKCADRSQTNWPDGQVTHGYPPHIKGLSDGDYIDVKICIDCHKCLGLPSADDILAAQEEES